MGPSLFDFLPQQFEPCECCKSRYTNVTMTTGSKWTKKEVEEQILYLAERVATTKWYNGRSELIRQMKHWVEKMKKIQEVENEFDLS